MSKYKRNAILLFILNNYNANEILREPIKSRNDNEVLWVYDKLYYSLVMAGVSPKLNITNNKALKALKKALQKRGTAVQLAPPHIHPSNAAKRAIQTFKNHLVAGLSSVDPNFSMYLWCHLIKQAELTLSM